MRQIIKTGLILFILIIFVQACQQEVEVEKTLGSGQPHNVILMIGDGMGVAQIQAAILAADQALNLESLSNIGFSKTNNVDGKITDSAAGGTAMACGVKTYNGAIGMDANKQPVKSILHYAEEAGLASGLVATSTITHATPASFIAHEESRKSYQAIARDFLDTDIDVFIGGGYNDFARRDDGLNLIDSLTARGYQVVTDQADLAAIKSGKLAALLNEGPMPPVALGRGDMLPEAAAKAIELLKQDPDGFFLMVEGSQIDWGGHENNIGYVVTELLDFDKTIGRVLDFARQDGNTLVIITADHETGGLSLLDVDVLGDSTAVNFSTDYHTGVMVPVYAYGPGAEAFMGTYENTAIFDKMMAALGLDKQ